MLLGCFAFDDPLIVLPLRLRSARLTPLPDSGRPHYMPDDLRNMSLPEKGACSSREDFTELITFHKISGTYLLPKKNARGSHQDPKRLVLPTRPHSPDRDPKMSYEKNRKAGPNEACIP